MRKVLIFFIVFILLLLSPQAVSAEITVKQEPPDPLYYFDKQLKTITLTFSSDIQDAFLKDKDYSFFLWKEGQDIKKLDKAEVKFSTKSGYDPIRRIDDKTLNVDIPFENKFGGYQLRQSGSWIYRLYLGFATIGAHRIKDRDLIYQGSYYINPCSNTNNKGCPSLGLYQMEFQVSQDVPAVIINVQPNYKYTLWFKGESKTTYEFKDSDITETAAVSGQVFPAKTVTIKTPDKTSNNATLCLSEGDECDFSITGIHIKPEAVPLVTRTGVPLITSNEPGVPDSPPPVAFPTSGPPLPQHCAQWVDLQGNKISKQDAVDKKDIRCIAVATAVGDVATDPFDFVKKLMSILLSLAGGIAVILIIISGYKFMASQGNPEAVQAAREQLTSAIVGFLFIIFSLVILQVVGVDILRIPGFEK